ncbi:A/G-specific adenine glycosylase [Methanocalculus taiwanensis]|uniref:Adenine DNA glycosylase n=2 Tax=Methanocalculus taiwanensis TaxID=106207 RepID=A0ABD4TJE1_9EURY|nr:A/G-specific adenine glycosylase [Methanocalculus taiwanensis]MCQ1537622.1 A/G-specific adenine glycosylase [Methanocalculus taiwanensis]
MKAAVKGPCHEAISLFSDMVLSYYQQYGRDLPWRRTTDPYSILVSEVMLQQTQVERVAPKFIFFIEQFPTINSLASAPLSEVLSAWSGLGYNRRAINLQKAAIILRDEYGGSVPDNPDILARLPGIGKATAAAICAYAFNMPVVYIETNIRRICIHYFFQDQNDIPDTEILPIIHAALSPDNPREWYSALMDYGTYLKKRLPNPNRRSTHYTRQAPFDGSDRKIRGQALRLLLDRKKINKSSFISALNASNEREDGRIEKVLNDLEKEGFVREEAGVYSIKE